MKFRHFVLSVTRFRDIDGELWEVESVHIDT